jgi:hypothetical protein
MNSEAFEIYKAFAKLVSQHAEAEKQAGRAQKISLNSSKLNVEKIDPETRYLSSSGVSPVTKEWLHLDIPDFYDSVHVTPQATNLVTLLTDSFKVPNQKARQYLLNIVDQVCCTTLNRGPLQDQYFHVQFEKLINEIEHRPIEHACRLWIRGLYPIETEFSDGDRITIRRPIPEDYNQLDGDRSEIFQYLINPFAAIIDLTVRCFNTTEAELEIQTVLDVLRMTTVAPTGLARYEIFPKTLGGTGYFATPDHNHKANYDVEFTGEDFQNFRTLIEKLRPLLSTRDSIMRRNEKYLGIAFERYKEALLERTNVPSRIAWTIVCLEALYLNGEDGELKHRLCQRAAAFLGFSGFEKVPLDAYKSLRDAYDIRSQYLHGTIRNTKNKIDRDTLCIRLLDYARVSLIIFAQMDPGAKTKLEILTEIDSALIDRKTLDHLAKRLENLIVV